MPLSAAVLMRSIIAKSLGRGGNIDLLALPHTCCPHWDIHHLHQIYCSVIYGAYHFLWLTRQMMNITFPPVNGQYIKRIKVKPVADLQLKDTMLVNYCKHDTYLQQFIL